MGASRTIHLRSRKYRYATLSVEYASIREKTSTLLKELIILSTGIWNSATVLSSYVIKENAEC